MELIAKVFFEHSTQYMCMVILTVEHILFYLATEFFTSDFVILGDFIMIENLNMKYFFLIKFYKF